MIFLELLINCFLDDKGLNFEIIRTPLGSGLLVGAALVGYFIYTQNNDIEYNSPVQSYYERGFYKNDLIFYETIPAEGLTIRAFQCLNQPVYPNFIDKMRYKNNIEMLENELEGIYNTDLAYKSRIMDVNIDEYIRNKAEVLNYTKATLPAECFTIFPVNWKWYIPCLPEDFLKKLVKTREQDAASRAFDNNMDYLVINPFYNFKIIIIILILLLPIWFFFYIFFNRYVIKSFSKINLFMDELWMGLAMGLVVIGLMHQAQALTALELKVINQEYQIEELRKAANIKFAPTPPLREYWTSKSRTQAESEFGQIDFQDPATPIAEGIIDIHHHVFLFLVLIFIMVSWILFGIIIDFWYNLTVKKLTLATLLRLDFWWYLTVKKEKYSNLVNNKKYLNLTLINLLSTVRLTHHTVVEIIWTILPSIILYLIAVPSFLLLYSMDEIINPAITLKAIGHQWYWSYEYSDYKLDFETLAFDSYMIPENNLQLGQLRLLEVDNPIILPVNTHIRVIVTATDVIHCWAVPSLGIKIDAVPGRLNQGSIYLKRLGVFYGQCSEICGVNHGFMPIVVKSVTLDNYISWIISKFE